MNKMEISNVMYSFLLEGFKKAFNDGQNSVNAEISWGENTYIKKVTTKNFDKWFEENYSFLDVIKINKEEAK